MYRRQLGVSGKPFSRVRLLLLGNSGVGKTTLVESLKCGYIRSLFRRSGATMIASQAKGIYALLSLPLRNDCSLQRTDFISLYVVSSCHII